LSSSAEADDPVFTDPRSYFKHRDYWIPACAGMTP
jgi:hypothetical protein